MGSRTGATRRSLAQATLANIEDRFARVIPSSVFNSSSGPFFQRERLYPLFRVFWCWIWQVLQQNTSCREVVRQTQALFGLYGSQRVGSGNAAYCQARGKLPSKLLEGIFASSSAAAEQSAPRLTLLQGRPLRVIDSTGVRLPDTASNRARYPFSGNQFKKPCFPVMKVLALFSLASGAIKSIVTGSWHDHELRLLMQLTRELTAEEILVGDRAFAHYVVAAWLQGKAIDLVARLATTVRKVDFRKAQRRLASHDAIFLWKKPLRPSALLSAEQWTQLPAEVKVRIIRCSVRKSGFRTRELTVVTTLLDPVKYPAEEVLRAYAARWKLELCFDDLKTTLAMEMLSCRTSPMVEKELLVFMIAYNLIRWVMIQALEHGTTSLQELSFKGTLDAFRQSSDAMARLSRSKRHRKVREKLWQRLLTTLLEDRVPLRPGRREPRAVKRPRKYDPLRRPRHSYKDRPGRRARARMATAKKKNFLK
jgi:hypothetical protein